MIHTIQSANDYYAFGKVLRSFNGGSKFGHQDSQRENELSENDNYTPSRARYASNNNKTKKRRLFNLRFLFKNLF